MHTSSITVSLNHFNATMLRCVHVCTTLHVNHTVSLDPLLKYLDIAWDKYAGTSTRARCLYIAYNYITQRFSCYFISRRPLTKPCLYATRPCNITWKGLYDIYYTLVTLTMCRVCGRSHAHSTHQQGLWQRRPVCDSGWTWNNVCAWRVLGGRGQPRQDVGTDRWEVWLVCVEANSHNLCSGVPIIWFYDFLEGDVSDGVPPNLEWTIILIFSKFPPMLTVVFVKNCPQKCEQTMFLSSE